MVYSNTKRGAYRSSIVNQSQGGGNKKAGFPYQVGRDSWSVLLSMVVIQDKFHSDAAILLKL